MVLRSVQAQHQSSIADAAVEREGTLAKSLEAAHKQQQQAISHLSQQHEAELTSLQQQHQQLTSELAQKHAQVCAEQSAQHHTVCCSFCAQLDSARQHAVEEQAQHKAELDSMGQQYENRLSELELQLQTTQQVG